MCGSVLDGLPVRVADTVMLGDADLETDSETLREAERLSDVLADFVALTVKDGVSVGGCVIVADKLADCVAVTEEERLNDLVTLLLNDVEDVIGNVDVTLFV